MFEPFSNCIDSYRINSFWNPRRKTPRIAKAIPGNGTRPREMASRLKYFAIIFTLKVPASVTSRRLNGFCIHFVQRASNTFVFDLEFKIISVGFRPNSLIPFGNRDPIIEPNFSSDTLPF